MLAAIQSSEDHVCGQQQPKTSAAEAATPRVLLILATILERLVARDDPLIEHSSLIHHVRPRPMAAGELGTSLKVFNGVRAPSISIAKYLERLYKYTNGSPSCFVVGYVYIDRLVHKHPELLVISLNVHRLLLTSVMVASLVLDDVQYNNAFYAKVGGVSNSELNKLELELLFLLDFEVTVSSPIFHSYCWYLEKEDLKVGSTRIQKPLAFDIKVDVNGI